MFLPSKKKNSRPELVEVFGGVQWEGKKHLTYPERPTSAR
jgi:hypothetical protein